MTVQDDSEVPIVLRHARPTAWVVWSLALPVLGQNFLNMCVGWSDTILTGKILEHKEYVAAVTVGAYLLWLIECAAALVWTGSQAVVSRLVGARDYRAANRVVAQSLLLAFLTGVVIAILLESFVEQLIGLMALKDNAHGHAIVYMRIIGLCVPLYVTMLAGATCLRAAGYTLAGMWIEVIVNVVNISCSWLLAVGVGPLPKLGWSGIAIGTALGYATGGIIAVVCLVRGYGVLKVPPAIPKPRLDVFARILRVGGPGGLNALSVVCGHLWFIRIIANLGDAAVAAHGVALRSESMSWLAAEAFAVAAATLVGQSLGAARPDLARRYGWIAFRTGASCMAVMALFFFFVPEWFCAIFLPASEVEVFSQAAAVLRLVAVSSPALAACIILTGAIRGAGDTRWPLLYNTVGLFLVRVPLAYLLVAPPFSLGLYGAWIAMVTDIYFRGLAAAGRYLFGGWTRTRV